MDVTLQPISATLLEYGDYGFNPCFNGCYSSTGYDKIIESDILSFQSLF